MRNVNIFRTHITDHIIPNEIMRRALVLSPGKDWTDQKTEAYKYLKRWALKQDERFCLKPIKYKMITDWGEFWIPNEIFEKAEELSPGLDWKDKRTKAYKFMLNWALEQNNNENSK